MLQSLSSTFCGFSCCDVHASSRFMGYRSYVSDSVMKGDCVYTGVESRRSLRLDHQFILLDMGWISMSISLCWHLGWSFNGEAIVVYLELRYPPPPPQRYSQLSDLYYSTFAKDHTIFVMEQS